MLYDINLLRGTETEAMRYIEMSNIYALGFLFGGSLVIKICTCRDIQVKNKDFFFFNLLISYSFIWLICQ